MNFEQELLKLVHYFSNEEINFNDMSNLMDKWTRLKELLEIFCSQYSRDFYLDKDRRIIDLQAVRNYAESLGIRLEREETVFVNPVKGVFYCSECNLGGDVLTLLANAEKFSLIEAAELLADGYLKAEDETLLPSSAETEKYLNYLKKKISISQIIHEYIDATISPNESEVFTCWCPFCDNTDISHKEK